MFDSLQQKIRDVIRKASGRGRLSEADVKHVLSNIRVTLLEADVHFQVAKNFCDGLNVRLEGSDIFKTLTPEQTILKATNKELIHLLGDQPQQVQFEGEVGNPDVIMLVGLYGVGKTTLAAKLAHLLKTKYQRKPMLVSCDASRPAAHEQLITLADQASVKAMPPPDKPKFNPVKRVKVALAQTRREDADVLIVDTAGRSTLDGGLIEEIRLLNKKISPTHVWLVLDSMLGQSSIQIAGAFHQSCSLTGNIITKCDGDARGGVALSAVLVTGKPIYYLGVGERLEDLEAFEPAKMASRILDLGDMEGLFEKAEAASEDISEAELMEAIQSGKFHLEHFMAQLNMLKKMGPVANVLKMIPGMGQMMGKVTGGQMSQLEANMKKFRAIMGSMTPEERKTPRILNGSRRKRIANGSGATIQDVNTLIRQFEQMKKMMKMMSGGKMPPGFGGNFPFRGFS